jgi:trans-aconitate methyltransferase
MTDASADPRDTYGAAANPDLLSRVPDGAGALLDVGCGAGAMGRALRARAAPPLQYV